MMDVPEALQHWVPVPLLALGFWFLLKRTFKDFETKLAHLFGQLEASLKQTQDHETRIRILEDRAPKRRR